MPGAPNSNPGRQGVARLLLAAGQPGAVTVGFDLTLDADASRSARSRRRLAARARWPEAVDRRDVRRARAARLGCGHLGLAATVASLAQELGAAPPAALKAWGIGGPDATAARAAADARVAAAASISDPVKAAGVLLGGPAVVEGSLGQRCRRTSAPLSATRSRSWDRARACSRAGFRTPRAFARLPRASATRSCETTSPASAPVRFWAAQSPAAPYVATVDAASAHAWVGLPFPAALGAAPVTSAVIVGDDASGAVTGIELDAWTEVIPNPTGTAAVTANLTAPDARAPNVILLAVPPDTSKPWTQESLLSVVDEAMELADCRMVDLDATRRVPALLPAVYLAEFDENDLGIRRFLNVADTVSGPLGREGDDMTTVYSLTRVEPVSRGGDPGRGLAATVQDPFWMLARQRQFGELTGEDAGSPVQVAFVQKEARFDGWKPESGAVLPYSPQTDVVEALVAGEAAGPAHSTLDRVQAGRALAAAVSKSVGAKLRAAFPLHVAPDSPRMLVRAAALFADGLAVAAAFAGAVDGTDAAARRCAEASDSRRESRARRPHRIRALVRDHVRHRAEQLDSRAPRAPLRARRRRHAPCSARPATRAKRSTGPTSTSSPTRTRRARERPRPARGPDDHPVPRPAARPVLGVRGGRARVVPHRRGDERPRPPGARRVQHDLRQRLVHVSDPRHVRIDAGRIGSRRARHLRDPRADRAGGGRAMGHVSADRIVRSRRRRWSCRP